MPVKLAISGVKNSGKTTLIERLIPYLKEEGLKIGVIKHDGHDFNPDVKGTDSYRHRKAGVDGNIIFSKNKYMLIENKNLEIEEILKFFTDYDLVLLEGFKNSNYPKLELIRSKNSKKPVTKAETVLAYITDLNFTNEKTFPLDDIENIADFIYDYYKEMR